MIKPEMENGEALCECGHPLEEHDEQGCYGDDTTCPCTEPGRKESLP